MVELGFEPRSHPSVPGAKGCWALLNWQIFGLFPEAKPPFFVCVCMYLRVSVCIFVHAIHSLPSTFTEHILFVCTVLGACEQNKERILPS